MKEGQIKKMVAATTPTMPTDLEKFKEEQMRIVQEIAKTQTSLLEVYLLEWCEVNKVQESELRGLLKIGHYVADGMVAVINADDERDIKIGIKCHSDVTPGVGEVKQWFEVFGEYIAEKDNYPKTTKFLETINNKSN